MAWPPLTDPDEDGVSLLVDGPSAYHVGPGNMGVIIIGAHASCPEDEHGIIFMSCTDDLFDMMARCASCRKRFHFNIPDVDQQTDFVAWGLEMMNHPPHRKNQSNSN